MMERPSSAFLRPPELQLFTVNEESLGTTSFQLEVCWEQMSPSPALAEGNSLNQLSSERGGVGAGESPC
jgi:hypothetical protein